ncbi:hypothetical protein RN001_009490 [Aquatica leii]|uniref:Chitobiosyldiphosphodolichol beta-mannosyltransferase n=1 Tax=Aquatica leii TaxID=1421715 RepID=A0AAN7P4U8_9COLE|nr:hypothetical protein RN001_009490 [Aquatica leii]
MTTKPKNVCIVVLGDIGRSPRMQYHSLSLAEHGHIVDVVGYGESDLHASLKSEPLLSYHYIAPYPSIPLPRFLNYILKTIWQAFTLLFVLLIIRKPDKLIVQNPPAVPSLLVCWFYSIIIRANLIIDWHNYAYTIMALNVGPDNILVKLTKSIERFVGQRASANFCVTNAMKNNLEETWSIRATTLYDRPPEMFHPISLQDKHDILMKLSEQYQELWSENGTVFTRIEAGNVILKDERPGLLISSTSWTEDEDFSILLQALQEYEDTYEMGNINNLPSLICIITGKGPLKDFYCKKIAMCKWKHITVITPWLESADYPKLLACADLGVCLHTSSSGYDLPMKVVDMFGCGIPVCAYDFKCLNELVHHEINGFIFKDLIELSKQLQNWFAFFPKNKERNIQKEKFIKELEIFQNERWRENWNRVALEYFN